MIGPATGWRDQPLATNSGASVCAFAGFLPVYANKP